VELRRGDNPTLLYGYGGFNHTMEPRFSRSLQVFLEHGGVYVQSILRGGGEFGEAWHRAGQLHQKQNTFDDFIAVAEDLQVRRITDRRHLAVHGRSNGGLLVAAVLTQRPDLFRAAVAGVPLTDMLRYPKFLIGRLWEPEYGSPEDPEDFRALLAYSPYHKVRVGTHYPAVLVTTAESDTRVHPLHARKFIAALQHASSSDHPILLRTERVAGHGAGTPVSKQVSELTDIYSFLFAELGVSAAAPTKQP
jgi:prolyl oligopeptidase